MDKIYIVTQGCYSDYHICGVFDDEDLARKFCDSFKTNYDEMDVEEWSLNPFKIEIKSNMRPYFLRMDKSGNASDIRIEESSYGFGGECSYGFDIRNNMFNHCFAKDAKHAVKITNELRTSLIATNQWKE